MPALTPPNRAAELQRLLAELTGHTAAHVRPYGKHLLIQMQRESSLDTVARLTESARNNYLAAFRTHSGRWEPLPAAGNMREVAEAVVSMLAPYLDPNM
jgi:hypothetical protein